ncbi:MAG TPA: PAS domain-containing protein [Croceibacterium sp.]
MNLVVRQAAKSLDSLDLGLFYEAVFNSEFAVYVIRFDNKGVARFEDANAIVTAIAGRPLQDIVGCTPRECMPAEVGECLEIQLQKCFASRLPVDYERAIDTPEGRKAFKTSLTPVTGRFGKVEHVVGITRDITAEANLVEDAEQNARLLKRLGVTFPNAIYMLNVRDASIRFLGGDLDEQRRQWRGQAEEAGAEAALRFMHPDDQDKAVAHMERLAALDDDEVSTVEFRIMTPTGDYRPYLNRETVFSRNAAGAVEMILGVSEDVSELDRAEQRVRDLSERLLTSQIDERRRIAEDLHDSTGQHLFAVGLALTRARSSQLAGGKAHESRAVLFEAIEDAKHSLQIAQREVRMLSYLLHPPEIVSQGLCEAIRNFARGFARRSGHYVEVNLAPEADSFEDDVSLNLFRACQEALTNIYRHAEASQAVIVLAVENGVARLEITDDGVGLDASQTLGVGLSGMQERMRRLGGDVQLSSGPAGTTLRATVPLAAS